MDPYQALSDIRVVIAEYNRLLDADMHRRREIDDALRAADNKHVDLVSAYNTYAEMLAEITTSFEALDSWLSRGGFSPWNSPR